MKISYKILFHPLAEIEYLDSVDWYETALPGLGEEFVLEVQTVINQIIHQPKSFPAKRGKLREAVLKRFPFIVVYRVDYINRYISILSVFHTSRNPRKKHKR